MSHKRKPANRSTGEKSSASGKSPDTSSETPAPGGTSENDSGVDLATVNPQQFQSGREVAAAIARQYDLAIIGGRLLSGAKEVKGASVCLRMFETTMEYLFGKPSSHPHHEDTARPRIIWDMPAPARELIEEETP